ncbi:MAG TPA: hypothetical protein DCF68_14515 [Cyanothece sp. UBA12306]|nr:hypothetical protein [Cyanothece sp. UBA12306]
MNQEIVSPEIISKIDDLANLVIIVLGSQNSGKSRTWNTLFGQKVKTGRKLRKLNIGDKCVDIFLINGSPEERKLSVGDIIVELFLVSGSPQERERYVGDIIKDKNPRIVLCSIQDIPEAKSTFNYFSDRGYFMFIHWLNPGFRQQRKSDQVVQTLLENLQPNSFIFKEKDGNDNPLERVNEMKNFLGSWAKRKKIIT